jgi:hypothetical protein
LLVAKEHFGGITMRTGLFIPTRFKLVRILASAFACAALPFAAQAQMQNGGYNQADASNGRATQAIYTTPSGPAAAGRQSSYVDSYGNPLIVPAGYYQGGGCGDACSCGNCYGGGCNSGYGGGCGCGGYGGGCNGGGYGCQGQCGCGGGSNSCMPMGGGGTDPPVGYDLMNDAGSEGDMTDQRGPHYFDIRTEAVWLHRDKSFGTNVDIAAQNVGNTVVLSTNQLDIQDQVGFRAIGRYDIGALSVMEFGYTGIYDYSDSAAVTNPVPGNLFTLFSRTAPGTGLFGINPIGPPSVSTPGGPLPFSERAIEESISLKSDLQTAELSYRRYWLGWSPRISGTLLAGFRYTKVDEHFELDSLGTPNVDPVFTNPAFEYRTDAINNLAGFQAGGDAWIGLMQGLRIGAEGKAGIYDNHYDLQNHALTGNAGSLTEFLPEERFNADKVAFIGEASADVVADITPSISLRAGYEVLFINSLVLAGENFNQTSPFGNQGTRVPFVDDNGKLFYSGAHAGIEYTW